MHATAGEPALRRGALPSSAAISFILPSRGEPSLGEGIRQGEQCQDNTVPLDYSPALEGNIVPGLFLLSDRALRPPRLL